jgi:hypothetical protein
MRLILENGLQRSLRDFRLVRRVRREELRAQQQLVDARRLVVRVRAAAEKREVIDGALVLRRELAEPAPRFDLGPRARDLQRLRSLTASGIESNSRSTESRPITSSISLTS